MMMMLIFPQVTNAVSKSAPCPRSGCVMFPLADGRGVVVYGGFTKEPAGGPSAASAAKKPAKKAAEVGRTLSDMFILAPDSKIIHFQLWVFLTLPSMLLCHRFWQGC